ncbi:uncharacterized protein LOC115724166 [Cannabis sativa]|uniref:uncharacterized protein LOC115724166 n=1 Tax=Cannabis sativa TaxID=3483 RepID=UPI0029C9F792|nr:uncharacterized protein LOC115724166 [Cannabis sativa]XP_060960229.1 uncharacterized protein LOC115724166 [Cannabis sativa]XP_060960230.1 uncharacterized protein LOC115724166 [Cannabis sativa]
MDQIPPSDDQLCKKSHKTNEQGCSVSLMSTLGDDIFLEILLRLPDFRCIVECSYVCKRWFSIISRSKAYFSHRFNHYHRQKRLCNSSSSSSSSPSLPFTLLFTNLAMIDHYFFAEQYISERSKILHYGQEAALNFLPWKMYKNGLYLESSFEDLLLVGIYPKGCLFVCNPFTRQFVELPRSPNAFHRRSRYALVVSEYSKIKYKVVQISTEVDDITSVSPPFLLHLTIFSSETGQWSSSTFNFPEVALFDRCSYRTPIVGSNGIVYWPYGVYKTEGLVALDICSKQYHLVGLPRELGHDWRSLGSRIHVGVVRGKVRLAQFFWYKRKQFFVFKAWELVDDDKMCNWNLVHYHDQMKMSECCMSLSSLLTIHALHPDDGDVFFFSLSNKTLKAKEDIRIFQCQMLGQNQSHIEILCNLPPKIYASRVSVVSLLHPWWPTQVPDLYHPTDI